MRAHHRLADVTAHMCTPGRPGSVADIARYHPGSSEQTRNDLIVRRQQAETEGRTGEVEGIDLTLTFLRAKRDDTGRRIRRPAAGLTIQRLALSASSEDER